MGLDFPRVDTADVGRLLLRLRDELEATNEALKNGSEDEKKAMVEKCSNFLLNESEKMVKLQDSVLGSSESFQQLPPIRIMEPDDGDLGHRINKIIQRASAATGLEVVVTDNEIMKAIKADPETAMNTEYTINTSMPQHLNDGDGKILEPKPAEFIGDRRGHRINTDKVVKGSNISNLPVRSKLKTDQQVNVDIKPEDMERGILNLIDRGIVPPAAQLELKPSPIIHDKAKLNASRQHIEALKDRTKQVIEQQLTKKEPQIKYDDKDCDGQMNLIPTPLPPPVTPANNQNNSCYLMNSVIRNNSKSMHSGLTDTYCLIIEQGVSRYNQLSCVEYLSEELWSTAKEEIIPQLEEVSSDYVIPIMIVTKASLKKICEWAQLARPRKIGKREILKCVENKSEVTSLMDEPGRIYTGPRREYMASLKITALFKGKLQRKRFLEYRKRQQAAGIIAVSWIMTVRMRRRKQVLIEQRERRLNSYYKRLKELRLNWPLKTKEKKILIHLPSLGYPKRIRFTATDLERRQMSQITRLVDSVDENTHVIFISPLPFTDDLRRYYTRLLGMGPAVKSRHPTNLEDETVVQSRFTVIVPEASSKFPTHCMNLAQHLNYSCEAMTRLKMLIAGKQAMIVPGVVCHDTLAIADFLNIPVYGSDPEVTHLYSTKSGARRIFQAAGVDMPPGEFDVYNIQQLTECLAELVTTYPYINRWLIKLDCQFDNRGSYVLDVALNLPCLPSVRRECSKCGENWEHKSFQQTSYLYVLNQLPKALATCEPSNAATQAAYPTWDNFMVEYCRQGGVVEACPATQEITNLTVDFEIEPNGNVKMLTCGDQVHSGPFYCWGWSTPQASVEPEVLEKIILRIANAAKDRKVLGFGKVSLLTFLDDQNKQHVWATGMKISPSDFLYMVKLLEFSTNTHLDAANATLQVEIQALERQTHEVQIAPNRNLGSQITRKTTTMEKVIKKQDRFAVISTQLLHTNLAILHYTVFFQMCRAHAIGWDVRSKIGTLFTLLDTVKRENIGMIYCGHNLRDAIYNFARGLHVIHQEISAPNMQGTTNFHDALHDIEKILEMIQTNVETDFGGGLIKLSSSLDKISSTDVLAKEIAEVEK
jgi:hypothetical protein